jgi:membrane-bound ClpP family serine protease
MLWAIIACVIAGILVIAVEVLFVPGTTFVGLVGALLVMMGISIAYTNLGVWYGNVLLLSSVVALGIFLWVSFQFNLWDRFALKESMAESKVERLGLETLSVGQEGVTVSALRPSGTAEFEGNVRIEVATSGPLVQAGIKIRIVDLSNNKITVEPLV